MTEIPACLRTSAFSLALILDSSSRMPLSATLFREKPSAAQLVEFVESAFARHGTPKHLLADRDPVFTAQAFRERVGIRSVSLRFCSAEHHRANARHARLERFWRTLKHDLLRLGPPARGLATSDLACEIQRALLYYLAHRPHQGLAGSTPLEAYLGSPPAREQAIQPPRGLPGDPPLNLPVAIEYLDRDRRFPFLRPAA